ncbi:MAG: PEP-CTERM sorting domain-containing protein [Phycisphaerae bacterium]|jgi:hypothetical protein
MKKTILTINFFVLLCVLLCASQSIASYVGSSPNLPPLDGQYVSVDQWHSYYGMGIYIANAVHYGFSASFAPPPVGQTDTHLFDSLVDLEVSVDAGATFTPFTVSAPVTVRIQGVSYIENTGTYSTEILSMNISGSPLPAGVMLRESPTLSSSGQTIIEDLGGGQYQIESFFDVYTELSIDGGVTWLPDLYAPVRMELIPEPATISLLTIGIFGLIRRK